MRKALEDIEAERSRQIQAEGWSIEHDDQHSDGSLADAAACYAATKRVFKSVDCFWSVFEPFVSYEPLWPESWSTSWWKPKDRRHDLVRAAALIVAEIERLDRSSAVTQRVPE